MRNLIVVSCILTVLSGCGGGGSEPTQVPQRDTIAPIIQLNGEAVTAHEQGTTYIDAGASATDNVDGTVDVQKTGEVGSAAGDYTITYQATDTAGNTATATRTVIVSDTTPPQLSLIGPRVVQLNINDIYVELGATAIDLVDGQVNVNIAGNVNIEQVGQYIKTYSASDVTGNTSEIARTVNVTDTTDDVIDVLDNGAAASRFDQGIGAFDEAIGFAECNNDGGAACPSISWQVVEDSNRGAVLEVEHAANAAFAGLFVKSSQGLDLTDFAAGALLFDIRTISGDEDYVVKLDCHYPCTSGDKTIIFPITSEWQSVTVPLAELAATGLDLNNVNTGIVIWAESHQGTRFQLDDIRFSQTYTGSSSIATPPDQPEIDYSLTSYGQGSVTDTINPASYRCVYDYGNWIYNAGVVAPAVAGCDTATGTPIGEPTPLYPYTSGPASESPLAAHRWWGSVSFMGAMNNGDPNAAGYITPDPITARISNTGFRMLGIPAGLSVRGNDFGNLIPDPFAEVFDGIAIGNESFHNLQARAYDHSDGSVTVEWHTQSEIVMRATFVHGSPYVYVTVLAGQAEIKSLRADGQEKGIYYQSNNSLGIWTNVAGNSNHYLITGDENTQFTNTSGNTIGINSASNSFTVALMPTTGDTPVQSMIDYFQTYARNVVTQVDIDFQVDNSTQQVVVTHRYLNDANEPVETIVGQQPLHWKNNLNTTQYPYKIRSARGMTKFVNQSAFSYAMPFVGVLPSLPTFADEIDTAKLAELVTEFMQQGEFNWSPLSDTYWSGKSYGKVAELIAIADAIDMHNEKNQLLTWLKAELEDWFNAETNGTLDTQKYFMYDTTWNTLLGMEESFAAHQQLNDHHFHYGYFVRAAAEICRHDASWCSDDNYGAMVKLLIRDYAGGENDALFPYLRHFDPANGFSWASGNVNFVRGNNNESTSEAANAYGAMILFGLIIGDQAITDRGIYLHASTTNTFWEYWNNIDGYRNTSADTDNFPAAYDRITTSIIWGDGAVFSTWFSPAYAHILGIQGLPTNPMTVHVGQYTDYLADYIELGLAESSNGLPSGLLPDQWRDIWWNIWALADPQASIADYASVDSYTPEAGESKAHTFHWIHTFSHLGQLATGTGELTADHPAAMAFTNQGITHYVAYNYSVVPISVTFSDGATVEVPANSFAVLSQ